MSYIVKGMPEANITHERGYKASLTGITVLKKGQFKSRYKLSSGYAGTAKGEIVVKPHKKDLPATGLKKTNKTNKTNSTKKTNSPAPGEVHDTNMIQAAPKKDSTGSPKLWLRLA